MSEYKILSYEDCLQEANETGFIKHLLLGNGFSVAYDQSVFSYKSLKKHLSKPYQDILTTLGTDDFEKAIEYINKNPKILHKGSETLNFKWEFLKVILNNAHPKNSLKVRDKWKLECTDFLYAFDEIFTTNYDLLLYWVTVLNPDKFKDGFYSQKKKTLESEESSKKTLIWKKKTKNSKATNIWYLHGALHLYNLNRDINISKMDMETIRYNIKKWDPNIIKYTYEDNNPLIKQIQDRFFQNLEPLIIMEGNSDSKYGHIIINEYLSTANYKFGLNQVPYLQREEHIITEKYQRCLFVFGQDLKEDSDAHILRSILLNTSKIYCGLFDMSTAEQKYQLLTKYLHATCEINFYDTSKMDIWGKNKGTLWA